MVRFNFKEDYTKKKNMLYEKIGRSIPNRHHSLIKVTQVKDIVPDFQLGPDSRDALDYAVFMLIVKASQRAEANGRTRIFPHDFPMYD
jgi:hypothetical protein